MGETNPTELLLIRHAPPLNGGRLAGRRDIDADCSDSAAFAAMAARIQAHQDRRGAEWQTLHAPLDVIGALHQSDGAGPRLLDCLTLWLTNLMLGGQDWRASGQALAAALAQQQSPVVIVTNEVGAGIVPENKLAREFRDAAGQLNQWIAHVADDVYLAVSGCELKVK